MNARESILTRVREAKPAARELPDVDRTWRAFERSTEALDARLMRVAAAGGSHVVEARRSELSAVVQQLHSEAVSLRSMCVEVPSIGQLTNDPHDFAALDVFVCEGELGVAEDGSVWIPASRLGQRAAFFLAAHVVLVLDRTRIVEHLHDAYSRIDLGSDAFGMFVAGPSKTADIEQSLVIGAHGPKGLTLIVVGSD